MLKRASSLVEGDQSHGSARRRDDIVDSISDALVLLCFQVGALKKNEAKKDERWKMKGSVLKETQRLKEREKEGAMEQEEMCEMRRVEVVIEELEDEQRNGRVCRNGSGLKGLRRVVNGIVHVLERRDEENACCEGLPVGVFVLRHGRLGLCREGEGEEETREGGGEKRKKELKRRSELRLNRVSKANMLKGGKSEGAAIVERHVTSQGLDVAGDRVPVLVEEDGTAGGVAVLVEKEARKADGKEITGEFFNGTLELKKEGMGTFVHVEKRKPEKGVCGWRMRFSMRVRQSLLCWREVEVLDRMREKAKERARWNCIWCWGEESMVELVRVVK